VAVEERWDAVRVDGAWHRIFWVAQGPTLTLDPGWLEPLLLAPPCVRTVAVVMEPVSLRAPAADQRGRGRGRGRVAAAERHVFRVLVHLQWAHAPVPVPYVPRPRSLKQLQHAGVPDGLSGTPVEA
jgi:hypothetical protein